MMDRYGMSDSLIVPGISPNKAVAAEWWDAGDILYSSCQEKNELVKNSRVSNFALF